MVGLAPGLAPGWVAGWVAGLVPGEAEGLVGLVEVGLAGLLGGVGAEGLAGGSRLGAGRGFEAGFCLVGLQNEQARGHSLCINSGWGGKGGGG